MQLLLRLLCSTLLNRCLQGSGGDVFALVYRPEDGVIRGLNGSGRAPYAAELEFFTKQGLTSIPSTGSLYPVTVPGTVDGWATILEACGTMTLGDVLKPAIEHAENGFPVSPQISLAWQEAAGLLSSTPDAAKTYLTNGRAPQPGEVFYQSNFANTLRLIAEGGREAFYHGEIAKKSCNSPMRTAAYSRCRTSLTTPRIGWSQSQPTIAVTMFTKFHPTDRGLLRCSRLNIAEGFDLQSMGHNSEASLHCLIEAMKLGFADLYQYITDPEVEDVPVTGLLPMNIPTAKGRGLTLIVLMLIPPLVHRRWAAIPFTSALLTRIAMLSRLSTVYLQASVRAWWRGIQGLCCRIEERGFHSTPNHVNRIAPHKRTMHTINPRNDRPRWCSPCNLWRDGRTDAATGTPAIGEQPCRF